LSTLGKIIGGGLPVGAYGGRAEIMHKVAPLGPMYQAGTLSGNPLAMAAGIATLRRLKRERNQIYPALERSSATVVEGIAKVAGDHGQEITTNRVGSMFTWFFQNGEVRTWDDAALSDTSKFAEFHRGMRERGVYLPPSQFEAAFMSASHSAEDIERTIDAARKTFAGYEPATVTSPL